MTSRAARFVQPANAEDDCWAPASASSPKRSTSWAGVGCSRAPPGAHPLQCRPLDLLEVAADVLAMLAQDPVLAGIASGAPNTFVASRVARHEPEGLLLAAAADHDRQVRPAGTAGSSAAASPGRGGPRRPPCEPRSPVHISWAIRSVSSSISKRSARGGNGKPRPPDSSWFQAAPMPSQARPPDSTSSVVAALTQSPG